MDQNAFKVRRLPVCNNRWSFKKFTVDGFSVEFLHIFFYVLVELLDENHEYWECISVSFMTIFQQVIVVSVADFSEFIIN